MKKVLVLVDCQKDFMDKDGALYVEGAEEIKMNIVELVRSQQWDKILITKDTHVSDIYKESDECLKFGFPLHCEIDTKGHDLFDTLESTLANIKDIDIHVFNKDKFDIWSSDEFNSYVDEVLDVKDQLTICGVATNYCVYYNVRGFINKGFKNIIIPKNCVKAIHDETESQVTQNFKDWNIWKTDIFPGKCMTATIKMYVGFLVDKQPTIHGGVEGLLIIDMDNEEISFPIIWDDYPYIDPQNILYRNLSKNDQEFLQKLVDSYEDEMFEKLESYLEQWPKESNEVGDIKFSIKKVKSTTTETSSRGLIRSLV